ncbi:dethiobiotin synthase [Erwinia piriflorinigrans]|uniref:ATP-dependent dethiobiotin synthetase BioD n=1 Tax=Erwinia piriflorinigrans CFBP 5888 TaxID=1161919 RepID=V5Z7L1_9GAMM|nr:dethiobiotin synthase [Erwinia piriflorinigrans]CCG87244.1 dethiobiotin synthetase [Erwinia piriflorinigrans CFBP 5888]
MSTRLFVTGTDTEVGKTVVSRALLQKLTAEGKRSVGYKPVAKSSNQTPEGARNQDALVLQASSSVALPYQAINPVTLLDNEISTSPTPISYDVLSTGLKALDDHADYIIVEGTGGWRSLMSDLQPLSDWAVREQLPVVLVVGIKLGCISHALLTAQAVINDGLPLCGWVANRINPGLSHYAEIIAVLRNKIPAPLLGEIPYLSRPETRELAHYLDLSPLF